VNFNLHAVRDLVMDYDPERPTGDPFLDARYEAHRAKFGHPMPYWRLFYHLCAMLKPAFSVELGAWQATNAAHMAAGYPYGDVVTIDHHGDPGDELNKPLAQEADDRYPNLHYLQGWTWDVVGNVSAWAMGIDLLFIDSWHHYDKAMQDWDAYRPLLSSPALVVCDDIVNSEPTLHRMVEFWEEISRGRQAFLVSGNEIHHGYPMGFIRYEG
jgi:predicted O-methyltransferase YrrM